MNRPCSVPGSINWWGWIGGAELCPGGLQEVADRVWADGEVVFSGQRVVLEKEMDEVNDYRISELPEMRVLVSLIRDQDGNFINDMGSGMESWAEEKGVFHRPGMREEFAYFDEKNRIFVFLIRIPTDFVNDGPYSDRIIEGGLVAIVSGERDHLVDRYHKLMEWIKKSERYELDVTDGKQRHEAFLDWLTPKEIHDNFDFEQQDIFIPIRLKRA